MFCFFVEATLESVLRAEAVSGWEFDDCVYGVDISGGPAERDADIAGAAARRVYGLVYDERLDATKVPGAASTHGAAFSKSALESRLV